MSLIYEGLRFRPRTENGIENCRDTYFSAGFQLRGHPPRGVGGEPSPYSGNRRRGDGFPTEAHLPYKSAAALAGSVSIVWRKGCALSGGVPCNVSPHHVPRTVGCEGSCCFWEIESSTLYTTHHSLFSPHTSWLRGSGMTFFTDIRISPEQQN